jgi:TolA-binding protein
MGTTAPGGTTPTLDTLLAGACSPSPTQKSSSTRRVSRGKDGAELVAASPAREMETLRKQVTALQAALAQLQGGHALAECAQLGVAQRLLVERVQMLESELEEAEEEAAAEADHDDDDDDDDDGDADADAEESQSGEDQDKGDLCGSRVCELQEELCRAKLQLHIAEDEMQQRLHHLGFSELPAGLDGVSGGELEGEDGCDAELYEDFVPIE